MSDSFLYSGDDAAMMSELQHCCAAAMECSGVSSESEARLLVATSTALAPECSLTFPTEMYMLKECTRVYTNPYLTVYCSLWLNQIRMFLLELDCMALLGVLSKPTEWGI